MKDESLSSKIIDFKGDIGYWVGTKDVKDFIQKLKDDFRKEIKNIPPELSKQKMLNQVDIIMWSLINKHFGPALIHSPLSVNRMLQGKDTPDERCINHGKKVSPLAEAKSSGNHSPQSEKSVALKRAEGTHSPWINPDGEVDGLDGIHGQHDDSCDCQLCSDIRKLHLGTTKNKSQEKCGGSDKIGCANCGSKEFYYYGINKVCKKCDWVRGSGNQNQDCTNKEIRE